MELELFTSKGGLRPSNSFKPEELAALTPARRIFSTASARRPKPSNRPRQPSSWRLPD